MRRLTFVGLALALSACGNGPAANSTPADSATWGTTDTVDPSGSPAFTIAPPTPVAPRAATLPAGSWVRDEIGGCASREEWFVIAAGGQLDHVLASRGSCGEPSLARYVGRWSVDQQVASLRWSSPSERAEREATFWSADGELQLGAYVPVDGGWHRRDALVREVGPHTIGASVDVGLRIDGLELSDGAACRMAATVTATLDDATLTESFDFDCVVEQQAAGFVIAADGMWDDGGWRAYLERRGVWASHGVRLGTALYEGFQPVFFTTNGEALWHERADSVYRFTEDSPPLSADELGE